MKFFRRSAGKVDGFCHRCPGMVQEHTNRGDRRFLCIECGQWQTWRLATSVLGPGISLKEYWLARWQTEQSYRNDWDCIVDTALDRILSRVEVPK